MAIEKVAVIGSGVMGSAIAAHIANAGVPVLLLDIVPDGASDKNQLAQGAIDRMKKADPAPFTHKSKVKLVTPGNLEEDLEKLGDCDWIIEAVLEDLQIKHDLYKKIDPHRKKGSVVSSNTSTIPLNNLTDGMPKGFAEDFLITHFFNPPRYMRLFELVVSGKTRSDAAPMIREFADKHLGKGVVECFDTPGFIANRIGCYWLTVAMLEALEQQTPVEVADAVMGRPVGIPKTGVFGLMDLIGIDLLPLIAKSFQQTLPKDDPFNQRYKLPDFVDSMIKDGYTGRKGKGGFYRLNTDGGKKVKEAKDIKTGDYAAAQKPKLASLDASKQYGLRGLVESDDEGGKFAWPVLRDTLIYSANLVGEIAKDINDIDTAMRLGYNWKYGPFQLIDKFGGKDMAGPKWFAEKLTSEGIEVPEIIQKAGENPFYDIKDGKRCFINSEGDYAPIPVTDGTWTLADIKASAKPVLKNPSATLWDVGDGVACLELTTKMNTFDPLVFEMIHKSIEKVSQEFKGLVIGNDGDNFSAGANLGFLLFAVNTAAWSTVEDVIKQGQDAFMALKYAPFPVVGAPTGLALGGGCEILLHCDAVNAHIETYTGLVEAGVGFVPGWGGCKESILRRLKERAESDSLSAKMGGWFSVLSPIKTLNTMPAIQKAFEMISLANVAKSAEQAKDMLILNEKSRITMNRGRLLADAKELCLELAVDYHPPHTHVMHLPGKTGLKALHMGIAMYEKKGMALPHDVTVSKGLARVLTGGDTDITETVTEQDLLDMERTVFMELVRTPETLARVEHMLNTGKPLRN